MAESTHSLTFAGDRVVKRYRSWDRGEPDREWGGLSLLHRYAPGTAPQPLSRRSEGGVPVIEMTRVPGVPLGAGKLSPAQVAALGQVLRRLYWSVPAPALTPLPERNWVGRRPPAELPALIRSWLRATPLAAGTPAPGAPTLDARVLDVPVPDVPVPDVPVPAAPGLDAPVPGAPTRDAWVLDVPVLDVPVPAAPGLDAPVLDELVPAALAAAGTWLDSADVSYLCDPPAEQVFTHGDGNIANFLWDGTSCRIVDFEDAGRSDPAYEAADLLEHVSVQLPGLIAPADLAAALDLSAPQQARLRGFRRLMAIYWLLMLLPGNPASARNPPGSLGRQAAHVARLL